MSNVIQVKYDELDAISQTFRREQGRALRIYGELNARLADLKAGGWVSDTADGFYREMDQDVMPSVKRLADALAQAADVTLQIKAIFKQAEEEAAAQLRDADSDLNSPVDSETKPEFQKTRTQILLQGDGEIPGWLRDIFYPSWPREPLPTPDNNAEPWPSPTNWDELGRGGLAQLFWGEWWRPHFAGHRDEAPPHHDPRVGTCEAASDYFECVGEILRRLNHVITTGFYAARFGYRPMAELFSHYLYGGWDGNSPHRPAIYMDPETLNTDTDFQRQVQDILEAIAIQTIGEDQLLAITERIMNTGEAISLEINTGYWEQKPRFLSPIQVALGTVTLLPYQDVATVSFMIGEDTDGNTVLLMTVTQELELYDFFDWCGENDPNCQPNSEPLNDYDHPLLFYAGDFTTLEKENYAAPFDIYSQWRQTSTYTIPYTVDSNGFVTLDLGQAVPPTGFSDQFDIFSNVQIIQTTTEPRAIQNQITYSGMVLPANVRAGSPIALLSEQSGYLPRHPFSEGAPGQRAEDLIQNE